MAAVIVGILEKHKIFNLSWNRKYFKLVNDGPYKIVFWMAFCHIFFHQYIPSEMKCKIFEIACILEILEKGSLSF